MTREQLKINVALSIYHLIINHTTRDRLRAVALRKKELSKQVKLNTSPLILSTCETNRRVLNNCLMFELSRFMMPQSIVSDDSLHHR